MSERGIHYVESDLDETWIRDWIAVGLVELEAYLDKHTAFVEYLRGRTISSVRHAVERSLQSRRS